jgi:hypothetical protein
VPLDHVAEQVERECGLAVVADDPSAHVPAIRVVGGSVDVADLVEGAVDRFLLPVLGDEAAAVVVVVRRRAEAGVVDGGDAVVEAPLVGA